MALTVGLGDPSFGRGARAGSRRELHRVLSHRCRQLRDAEHVRFVIAQA